MLNEGIFKNFEEKKTIALSQDGVATESVSKIEKTAQIQWHLIGHLQKNKVSKTVGRFALIHSVDSLGLAEQLSQVNLNAGLSQNILLQVNLTGEAQKHGFDVDTLHTAFASILGLKGVQLKGLMCFGVSGENLSESDFAKQNKEIFSRLQAMAKDLQKIYGLPPLELSMGMSQDYGHALEFGATIIRIGRHLLGEPIL